MVERTEKEERVHGILELLQQYDQIVEASLQAYGALPQGAQASLNAYRNINPLREALKKWGRDVNDSPYTDEVRSLVDSFDDTIERLAQAEIDIGSYLRTPEVREVVEPGLRSEREQLDTLYSELYGD